MKKGTVSILVLTVFALVALYWLTDGMQLGVPDSTSGKRNTIEGSEHAVDAGSNGTKTDTKGMAASGTNNNTPDKATASGIQRIEKEDDADFPIPAKEIQDKAEDITGAQVDISDYAKAGEIIIGKLSPSEIRFLFGSAKDDLFAKTSVEELEKIRSIIFSKLSGEDISILRAIGKKYGKSMHILDPDLDVVRFKAEIEKDRVIKKKE